MADINIQQKIKNSSGTYDNVYSKSKANLIEIEDVDGNFNATDVEGALKESHDLISTHTGNTSNPHSVTASQVGLGNVTNESKATMFTSPAFTGTPKVGGNMMYHVGNITISTSEPSSALAEGAIHMVY